MSDILKQIEEQESNRFIYLQDSAKERTFEELFNGLKRDMNHGLQHAVFDSMFAVLLKFSYELEEIKQCLKPSSERLTINDIHPEYHQEEKDE